MSHIREHIPQPFFQCCSKEEIESSLQDQDRSLGASYIKTSLKQKKKTTTTTSESRISAASSKQREPFLKKQVVPREAPSNVRVSFGRTEYFKGAYQQHQKQNPKVRKQEVVFVPKSEPLHLQKRSNKEDSALFLRSTENNAKQLRPAVILKTQEIPEQISSCFNDERQSPTFPALLKNVEISKIAQPSQSALRTSEEPVQQAPKKFFSEIKASRASTNDQNSQFKNQSKNSVTGSQIRPRTFTQGSLLGAIRKTETLVSKGSESDFSMASEVLQNFDSMSRKFLNK